MPKIYLSPSTQEYNLYYDNSGSEEYYMNLIADAMEPYLTANDIEFVRNNREGTVAQSIRESNNSRYDLHLALHSNASPESLSGSLTGADFYFYTASSNGRRAAEILADNYKSIYPVPSLVKAVPTMSLGEVRRTINPTVLAELAYHDNPSDAEWIKANIENIARNLVQGLCEYFGIPFVGTDAGTDIERIGVVTTQGSRLNIRSRPTVESSVIAQIPNGERVKIIEKIGNWYVIEYNGIIGFVFEDYITLLSRN